MTEKKKTVGRYVQLALYSETEVRGRCDGENRKKGHVRGVRGVTKAPSVTGGWGVDGATFESGADGARKPVQSAALTGPNPTR